MYRQYSKRRIQMLYKQTVDTKILNILKELQTLPELMEMRLVGGTSLALQIGHRISVDLDLFGIFNSSLPLEMCLTDFNNVVKTGSNRFMQFFEIDGVKVDFVNYTYPWLGKPVIEEGITLASIEDIAAMKVNAIINRGTKKDFIDMAFLLERYSLLQILDLYQKKYGVQDYQMALRSLTYFEDAELDVMPRMLINKDWKTVKGEILSQIKQLN